MVRFLALFRFLVARTAGVAALRRGLALYLTIGIVAVILFAGQGLDASTVVRLADRSVWVRVMLLAAWTVAATPIVRAIVTAPEASFVRALPVPRWQLLLVTAFLMIIAELPWAMLWTRGGGPLRGLGATFVALALHASLVAGSRSVAERAALVATFAAWLAGPPLAWLLVGAAAFAVALPAAWRRAPERRPSAFSGVIGGPPALALGSVYVLTLLRRHGAVLLRAALVVVTGLGLAFFMLRNGAGLSREGATLQRVVLALWIPVCVSSAAAPLGPMLRIERQAAWVLEACAVTSAHRRAATMGLVAATGASAGLVGAACLGAALTLDLTTRLALAASMALAGVVLAAITEACMRWAIREQGRDAARIILVLLAEIALAETSLWLNGAGP